jgi:dihydroorotate dehydrogenase electron transfer subunit
MEITKIKTIVEEAEGIKTFILEKEVRAIPGQFVMVWIPGVGEKPMSASYATGNLGITALAVGPFTNRLCGMKEGELLGIRGPYGRGFEITGEKLLVVGGGVGMPPLAALADVALNEGKNVTAIVGAKTKEGLLFVDRLKSAGADVITTTEDGTEGLKGFVTDAMADILKKEKFEQCFTCGPELMMHKVIQMANVKEIPTQASIERYFKCGIGVCSHCTIDYTGARVCMEGPVFTDKELGSGEFGKYARDASGKRIYFKT